MDPVLVNYAQQKLIKAHFSQPWHHKCVPNLACVRVWLCMCDCVKVLRLALCPYEDQPVLIIVKWATWWKNMHATATAAGHWTEQQFQQRGGF